jgi:hypothetical protein
MLVRVALTCRVETWVRPSGFLLAGSHSEAGCALQAVLLRVPGDRGCFRVDAGNQSPIGRTDPAAKVFSQEADALGGTAVLSRIVQLSEIFDDPTLGQWPLFANATQVDHVDPIWR